MCLSWPNIIADYSYSRPRNFVTRLCTVGLELSHEINYDSLLKHWVDCSVKICLLAGERLLHLIQQTIQRPVMTILSFGKSVESRGLAVTVEQIMKATDYRNISVDLILTMLSLFLTGNWVVTEENDPWHRDQIVLRWFHEYNTEFRSRFW